MFDEDSMYQEILQVVHKQTGEQLDGAVTSGASFHLHSLLSLLPDDLRRREVDVMRALAKMTRDGLFTSSGTPPLYRSSAAFDEAWHKLTEEGLCV